MLIAYPLWHTLGDDGNSLELGVLHQLHGGAVDTSGRGEVDNHVNVGVLGGGLVNLLVDRQESLAGAPVHLAHELTAESVDDAGDGGGCALADEVEVEHALDGTGLHSVDEASCLVGEEGVFGERCQGPAGGSKALDVIVGGQSSRCRGTVSSGGHCEVGSLFVGEYSRQSPGKEIVSTMLLLLDLGLRCKSCCAVLFAVANFWLILPQICFMRYPTWVVEPSFANSKPPWRNNGPAKLRAACHRHSKLEGREITNLSGSASCRAEYPKLQVGEMTRWGTGEKRSEEDQWDC